MSGVGDIRERRKQRILGNSEERMKKLMGINEQFSAEYPNKLESTKQEQKKDDIELKEKKVRKISFGNMANNKMAEKLRKERKISLNLERIGPINEEISGRHLVNEAGRRDFENTKMEIEKLKDLQRPPIKILDHIFDMSISSRDTKRKEYEEIKIKEEMEKKDRESFENEKADEVENLNEEEGFNDMEGRILIENYEAKLRSLEEFARKIDNGENDSKRFSEHKVSAKMKESKEEVEDEKPPLPPAPAPPPSSSRSIFMLVLGVFCRLFLSLLPLHLQNIMLIFTILELMIISYKYLFSNTQFHQAPQPNVIVSALLSMSGVNKEIYKECVWWVEKFGKIIGDLSIFLFSFIFLHYFLYDPLACEFDAR